MHAVTGVSPTHLEQGKPLHHRHDEAEQDPIKQQCPSMRLDVRLVFLLQSKPTRPTRAGSAPTIAHGTRISACRLRHEKRACHAHAILWGPAHHSAHRLAQAGAARGHTCTRGSRNSSDHLERANAPSSSVPAAASVFDCDVYMCARAHCRARMRAGRHADKQGCRKQEPPLSLDT